ncbi:MAG: UbiA-like polyprenyltransferase [Gemmatimonadota bacterium]
MSEPQTIGGTSRIFLYSNLVRLPHTAFALPFAVVGAALASYKFPVTVGQAIWIVVAFTAARFAAMAHNRVVDRDFDARNPRTARRELPSGRLSVKEAKFSIVAASAVFFFAAAMLNPLVLALSPVALAVLLTYSYLKRYTVLTHVGLGIADGIAPAAAYLAVSGRWSDPWYLLPLLALAVGFWVAGFDVLYALQDVDVDRAEGLHSIPARYGMRKAIWYSRLFQALAVLSLLAAGLSFTEVGALYFVGVAVVAVALVYEHSLVRPDDLSRLNAAFFNVNALISAVFCAFIVLDRALR